MSVNEQKKLLRKALLQKRKLLCDSETAVKNAAITENLLSLEKVRTADIILPFVSTDGEVDTREFITQCLKAPRQNAPVSEQSTDPNAAGLRTHLHDYRAGYHRPHSAGATGTVPLNAASVTKL